MQTDKHVIYDSEIFSALRPTSKFFERGFQGNFASHRFDSRVFPNTTVFRNAGETVHRSFFSGEMLGLGSNKTFQSFYSSLDEVLALLTALSRPVRFHLPYFKQQVEKISK